MVGNYVFHRLTGKCSLGCSHCGVNSTPNGYVPILKDVESILSHLPRDMEVYTISGGEPTESEDLLYGALEYIQVNRKKQMPNLKTIRMLTNGLWLTDENRADDLIGVLEYYDVNQIGVSFDEHHARAAKKLSGERYPLSEPFFVNMNAKMKKMYPKRIKLCSLGDSGALGDYKPMPFGRASNLPFKEQQLCSRCDLPSDNLEKINISPKGEVYFCCWEVPHTSLGSAIYQPVDNLIEKARKNPVFNALITGGPRKVASDAGIDIKNYPILLMANDCLACKEIFAELNSKGVV